MQSGAWQVKFSRISSGLREMHTSLSPGPSPMNGRGGKAVLATLELHLFPPFGRGQGAAAEALDDLDGTLDQLAVAGMYATVQPDVVLQAHAHMAAEQHGLGDHRHLHAP